MPRWTPPHPAAVIPRQVAARCPVFGERPFRTADLARAGLLHGMAAVRLTPVHHPVCGGWHNQPEENQ